MTNEQSKSRYIGLTHEVSSEDLPRWKQEKCSQNIHCFDEVLSYLTQEEKDQGFGPEHYLVCDACGMMVEIAKIETGEEVEERLSRI